LTAESPDSRWIVAPALTGFPAWVANCI